MSTATWSSYKTAQICINYLGCFLFGQQHCLHQIAEDVKHPTIYFESQDQVTLFYMNTGSFSRGNENLCQPSYSRRAPGADKTALSIEAA